MTHDDQLRSALRSADHCGRCPGGNWQVARLRGQLVCFRRLWAATRPVTCASRPQPLPGCLDFPYLHTHTLLVCLFTALHLSSPFFLLPFISSSTSHQTCLFSSCLSGRISPQRWSTLSSPSHLSRLQGAGAGGLAPRRRSNH